MMERLIPRGKTLERLTAILPLLILFLTAVLRFHLIAHQSLWNDEGNTLRLIERTVPDLIANAARDIHPPGYYLLIKVWWLFTGESEFALRAFSALAGVLSVACTYALGKALFARGAGIIAALLVAINSFSVYYGQEARMYALLAFLSVASLLVLVMWLKRPRLQVGLWLILINVIGLYTQYTYPFVMIVQGIMFVLWWVRKRDTHVLTVYIVFNLITLAFFAPLLPTAIHQITGWPRTGQPVDFATGIGTVAQWLVYGNTTGPLNAATYLWPVLFMLAAFLPDWRTRDAIPSWWRRLLPLLWLLITVVPLFGFGLFREANLKFLLPAQIATALLIGRGMWYLWEIGSANMAILIEAIPRLIAAAGLAAILSQSQITLNNLYTDIDFARANYRAMSAAISTAPRPDDAIILDAPNQVEVFTYYYRGNAALYQLPEGLGGDDVATAAAVNKIVDQHRRIFVLYWGESERDPNRIVEKTLASRAFEAKAAWYGDVRFVQYATLPPSSDQAVTLTPAGSFGDSITLQSASLSADTLRAGDVLGVSLTWITLQPLTTRYKVFVQLLTADGTLAAQHDSEPGNNMKLTTTWLPGESVTDSHGLLLPLTLPAGDYTVIVGLYDVNNPADRVRVTGAGASGDFLTLAKIKVER